MSQQPRSSGTQSNTVFLYSNIGSSAREIPDSDLSPQIIRKKETEARTGEAECLERLCERYKGRGISEKVRTDAVRQQKQQALDRAVLQGGRNYSDRPGAQDNLSRYRSESVDGGVYMTPDDFKRYFKDRQVTRAPQYRAAIVSAPRHDEGELLENSMNGGVALPKKAGWLTDTNKLPAWSKKWLRIPLLQKLNVWAGETFPRETLTEKKERGTFRKMPFGGVAALVTAAVCMMLVIGSTVLVSQATIKAGQVKQTLEDKKTVYSLLSDTLTTKNETYQIERRAKEELGMVDESYLRHEIVENEAEEYLEVANGQEAVETQKSGWSAILSAFGIGDN